VLHVENGRDIFITIFGEFKPSFFGLRPETLMKLAKPIADYEISELMLIDRDDENKIPYQEENTIVPRQLFLLIDYLYKNGLKTRELFTVNRKYKNSSKIHQIRDWLDENSSRDCREFSSLKLILLNNFNFHTTAGTPQTVAETLLKFLESLPSPLITISERELSIYSAYFEKCRDLLQNKVSLLNRKIFWYILMFLKESQKYYNVNGLDDRLLGKIFCSESTKSETKSYQRFFFQTANVFGRVLCRHSNEQYQQRFVLNFLQNDIETFAKCDYKNLFH
jgi:phosphatidylinositol-bisphosphatase